MKNVPEVLLQKQIELASAMKELEALRIVAPLLRDEEDSASEAAEPTRTAAVMLREAVQAEAAIDLPPPSSSGGGRLREATKRFFPLASIRRHS